MQSPGDHHAAGHEAAAPNEIDEIDLYRLRARTIENLEQLLEQANAEVELMRSSTSWRLTAPLRAAGRVARRLLGGSD